MFASPASAAEIEELVYETSPAAGALGPVFFVTALVRHEARERETRESHVFLPRAGLHLHEVVFAPMARAEAGAALADAVRATHGLLAAWVNTPAAGAAGRGNFAYATRRLTEHPFHEFRVRGWFADALWEMQDWTVSGALREALGRVTRYRADADEAELLRRVFAAS